MASAEVRRMARKAKAEILRLGLLPFSDAVVPSVVSIVAGAPVSGSWWGHPAGKLIYWVGEVLDDDPDVLVVRLWRAKRTVVHRRLWPALARIGQARSPWQMSGLGGDARGLLEFVDGEGAVRSDQLPAGSPRGSRPDGAPVRDLESRLLVLTRSVHTATGAHALEVESWAAWRKRTRTRRFDGSIASARRAIEVAARSLEPGTDLRLRLPWQRAPRNEIGPRPSVPRTLGSAARRRSDTEPRRSVRS